MSVQSKNSSSSPLSENRSWVKSYSSQKNIPLLLPWVKTDDSWEKLQGNKDGFMFNKLRKQRFSVIKEESSLKEKEERKSGSSILLNDDRSFPSKIFKDEEKSWFSKFPQEEEDLEVFLSSIVHEFRQPINAFKSSTEVLQMNLTTLKAIFEGINDMSRETKKEGNNCYENF